MLNDVPVISVRFVMHNVMHIFELQVESGRCVGFTGKAFLGKRPPKIILSIFESFECQNVKLEFRFSNCQNVDHRPFDLRHNRRSPKRSLKTFTKPSPKGHQTITQMITQMITATSTERSLQCRIIVHDPAAPAVPLIVLFSPKLG